MGHWGGILRDSHGNLESGATKITTTPGRHSRFGSALPLTKWDDQTYILLPQENTHLKFGGGMKPNLMQMCMVMFWGDFSQLFFKVILWSHEWRSLNPWKDHLKSPKGSLGRRWSLIVHGLRCSNTLTPVTAHFYFYASPLSRKNTTWFPLQKWNGKEYIPYNPCMVYLPTFGWFLW